MNPTGILGSGSSDAVAGAEELEKVGRRLVEIGDNQLRKQLLKGIRTAAKPLVEDIRESARDQLPHRGGLAELIAKSKMGIRTRLSGNVSVRLVATSPHDLDQLNRGKLRHPVFGDRENWATQDVPKGWFDKPVEKREPAIRDAVLDAMHEIAEQATRRV